MQQRAIQRGDVTKGCGAAAPQLPLQHQIVAECVLFAQIIDRSAQFEYR
jgi:hypothetical protein